jgi:hypothetical protein
LENQKHSYGFIIAADVVHKTPFIGEKLAYMHSLLRPSALTLIELLPILVTIIYIFGHFPGWSFGEADGRSAGILRAMPEWDRPLKAAGFSRADHVTYVSEELYYGNYFLWAISCLQD